MNEFKEKYLEKKEAVLECLENTQSFLSEYGYEHDLETVKKLIYDVKNDEFTIVLVGEFSSGKSTFLNALMGEKILPSFSNETTATVNFLKHKDKAEKGESGCVYYNNGETKCIDRADFQTISKYVSTESEEEVAQNIKHLDLYLDSKFLENNVTLVDSPGLNGIAEGHKEITEEQIERSSASIFLFNANQPGSYSDFEFLRHLQKRVKSIFCVLNQIDCIKGTEGQTVKSVIRKLKENYKKMIPEAETIPEIIPVSAYQALIARGTAKMEYNGKTEFSEEEKRKYEECSLMKSFEDRLWKFLTQGEKAKQQLKAPIDQVEAKLEQIKEIKKEERDIIEGKSDSGDLEEKKLELENQREILNNTLQEKTKDIKDDLKVAASEMREEINSEAEDLKKKWLKKLDSWEEIEEIEPDRIKKDLEKNLNQIADNAMEHLRDRVGDIILQYNNGIIEEINEQLESGEFSFSFSGEIKQLEVPFLGIEEYDQKIDSLEKEIKNLEEEAEREENNLSMAIAQENKREELERKIESIIKEKESYMEITRSCIPHVERYTRNVRKTRKRGGFFGTIADFAFGEQSFTDTETVVDSTERDRYIKERDCKINEFDNKIRSLRGEYNNITGASEEKVHERERKKKQIEKEQEKKRAEQIALREEFKRHTKKETERYLKKQKEAIEEFIDDGVSDFSKGFKKAFRKQLDVTTKAVMDIIAGSIASKIESKTHEIELLQEKMKLAMENKENALAQIATELDALEPLLIRVIDLQSELEGIVIDTIEEVSLNE